MNSAFDIPGYQDLMNFLASSVERDMMIAAHKTLLMQQFDALSANANQDGSVPAEVIETIWMQMDIALEYLQNHPLMRFHGGN